MLASSGTRNSPKASSIDGRFGCNLFLIEVGAILGVICLLCRQSARASAQATGTCWAKPHPLHPMIPLDQDNHSLTIHSSIPNASSDDFVGMCVVRREMTCAVRQQLRPLEPVFLQNLVNALFYFLVITMRSVFIPRRICRHFSQAVVKILGRNCLRRH